MTERRVLSLPNEAATASFASALLERLPPNPAGWTLLLEGELGAGKSTFARALIRAMGHAGPVPSPTYTLIEPYELDRATIYHVDLYRIASPDELHYLGWDELDDGLRLVEWPDRAPELMEQADFSLRLSYEGDGRRAELSAVSGRAAALLEGWPNPPA
mgnify:FL=1|tara:strand:- start:1337 stop:1813 length:477 start_codon:yes stop_codon:yes gene_type:complete